MARQIPTSRAEAARRGGRALAVVREARGLNRAQVAEAAGWSVDRVAAVEEGSEEVEWLAVIDLLETMGADSGELSAAYGALGDDDPGPLSEGGMAE